MTNEVKPIYVRSTGNRLTTVIDLNDGAFLIHDIGMKLDQYLESYPSVDKIIRVSGYKEIMEIVDQEDFLKHVHYSVYVKLFPDIVENTDTFQAKFVTQVQNVLHEWFKTNSVNSIIGIKRIWDIDIYYEEDMYVYVEGEFEYIDREGMNFVQIPLEEINKTELKEIFDKVKQIADQINARNNDNTRWVGFRSCTEDSATSQTEMNEGKYVIVNSERIFLHDFFKEEPQL